VRLNRTLRVTPLIVLLAILAVSPAPVGGQSADSSSLEQISSRRYIVIDDKTGEIFAEKDPDERAGMASVTKVFTALVALERAPLDMEITTNDSDLFDQTSSLMPGLVSGKTYTMQDLLYGMVLASGNDAAHALARGIGEQPGDSDEEAVARFVTWMNDKVTQLGLANTHFVNPHGLSDPDHYTTPRDIATFMMYAVQNPDFMDVISALEYTTTTGDFVASINRGPQFIPDFVGGKTGFDFDTGYCLVEVGQRGDVQVVSVTIDGVAPDIWYQDHAILMDYAFAALEDRLAAGDPTGDNSGGGHLRPGSRPGHSIGCSGIGVCRGAGCSEARTGHRACAGACASENGQRAAHIRQLANLARHFDGSWDRNLAPGRHKTGSTIAGLQKQH
jgi:D-alanyl-D-alanine carboxypeptidase (penicillin-binding protein 5/6)